jgi:hypothetical protein
MEVEEVTIFKFLQGRTLMLNCYSKSPPTVHYKPDGTGRDTYVISGDGGLHGPEYRGPHDFGKNLRYYIQSFNMLENTRGLSDLDAEE